MSWADLSIDRSLLNSLEGETLSQYNNATSLFGISDNDDERFSLSKRQLKLDILKEAQHILAEGTITAAALLDLVAASDEDGLLKDLLAYYFLHLLFQDGSINTRGRAMEKHEFYYMKYIQNIKATSSVLFTRLNPPKKARQRRMYHGFG